MFVFSAPVSLRAQRSAALPHAFANARCAVPAARGMAVRVPALDVVEAEGSYTATLDMPGIAREQLAVAIEGRRVDVSTADAARVGPNADAGADDPADAKAHAQASPGVAERSLHRERSVPRYARSFVLPAELEPGTAQARLVNGVLTLTLPKRNASRAATVTVQ